MKTKLLFLFGFIPVLLLPANVYAQYKDLEGVFFGKIVSMGIGGSYKSHTDKLAGTSFTIAPFIYNVHLNNKKITTLRVALPAKQTVETTGNDGVSDYKQTDEFKLWELEFVYRFGVTKDGTDKPLSAFLNFHTGLLMGKYKSSDSRYGEMSNYNINKLMVGAGLTVFQRLGSRFMVFAEPSYKYDLSFSGDRIYVGENYNHELKFSHISGQAGIIVFIGKIA